MTTGPHLALIESLRAAIHAVLDPLLAPASRVALLDFPAHSNVGDSAIWLGTLAYLRAIGKPVCYTCDSRTYSREHLAARLGDGVILLHGGGNLGDLWEIPQRFRERVVRDFPDRPIIQLPQTMHFRDPAALARARAVFDAHPRLTLVLRDRRSVALARESFRAPTALAPDMAFALGPLSVPAPASRPVLWLARTDHERAGDAGPPLADTVDWLAEPPTPAIRLERWLRTRVAERPRSERVLRSPLSRLADRVARQRLRRGCTLLRTGRVVITDRLHAHILSLLLGIPSVVLDNNYGKVRQFYETWTCGSPLARWAESPAHALEVAAAWAR